MFARLRGLYGRILTPLARLLLAMRLSPTAVTIIGTVGVVVASLWFLPRGDFLAGSIAIVVCLLGDGLDGNMARLAGRESRFGAFLDSTLDRVADAAVFSGLVLWAAGRSDLVVWLALACLGLGFLVSYVRARAEADGWDASRGLFERTDRLVVTLVAVFAVGVGSPAAVLPIGLGIVALGSAFTVAQRIRAAAVASLAEAGSPAGAPDSPR